MLPLITDSQFNSVALVVIALIGIAPALYAKSANKNSKEAKENSQAAADSVAEVAHELRNNGGMEDPNPNLNDHIKYQTEMLEKVVGTVQTIGDSLVDVDTRLAEHLDHSEIMDTALADVYSMLKHENIPRSPRARTET